MEPRMDMFNQAPDAYKAMSALESYSSQHVDKTLLELIKIRASQLNKCAFCLAMHTKDARKNGESEERIYALNAWRESPLYTPAERAVLAFTEAVTLISDEHVPDDIYNEMKRHFDDKQIAQILMAIVTINSWNRIAIATRMVPQYASEKTSAHDGGDETAEEKRERLVQMLEQAIEPIADKLSAVESFLNDLNKK